MIVVIGGGILGASTAYHLAKAGEEVTLIDRKDLGQATDAAAGIICPWLSQRRNQSWYQLVKRGAAYYPDLVSMLEEDGETETGYKRVGTISLHHDEKKLEQMKERALKRREDAPEIGDVSILSAKETKERFPPLSKDYSSVFVSGGARVDGRLIRDALINAAKKYGATVIHGSATLMHQNNKVAGVKINGTTTLESSLVIDTTGAWSKQLTEPLGIQFNVTHQRAQIIHLELPDAETDDWPVVMPPDNVYLLTNRNGRVIIGATRTDVSTFDYRATTEAIHEILHKALTYAPGLSDSTFIETRVGFRPYTPGFLPVFGRLPHVEGIMVANGLGASGLTSGPYVGKIMAELALGKEPDIDLKSYDVTDALEG
ncbi:NAD(P)/FAD-dependent oxidoreductase [Bacillaceae bacterium W0354]